jgi:hypothetical protein
VGLAFQFACNTQLMFQYCEGEKGLAFLAKPHKISGRKTYSPDWAVHFS